ncbi:hypothetical protein BD769DRAFT_1663740 [Suillus cothurnatus]|nr:hypothetical protein BD769DRAFT_1663740 [Suillus cothurnatus]
MSTVALATTCGLYRNYDTRSNSTPQSTHPMKPTGHIQNSNMILKSLTPDLQLDKTECATVPKTSSTPIQEAHKDNLKPVHLQASATAIPANPGPLYDDDESLQQSLHHQGLTSKTGHMMEFHGIDVQEHELIEQFLEEMGRVGKLRLTYNYDKCSLLVEMPSAIHEAPFDYLKLSLEVSLEALPYDRDTIFVMVHMNSLLSIKRKMVMPDICITVTGAEGPTNVVLVPFLRESVFSEDKPHAVHKLKKIITAHPEIEVVVLALACKVQLYHKPEKGSPASATFHKDSEPLPLDLFITECFPTGTSIMVTDHNWCHISSVEFFIWVRGDDEFVINIDNEDTKHMAHGTLLPEINMDAVKVMLKWGVEKIQDSLVTFSKQLNPNIDTIELEKAAVTLPARWKSYNIAVKNSTDITAYNRYKAWHEAVITDGLELNPMYVPPTTVTSLGAEPDVNGSSKVSANHSHGCSKHKCTSTSLPPIHKVRQA